LAVKDSSAIASPAFHDLFLVEYIPGRGKFTTEAQRAERSTELTPRSALIREAELFSGKSSQEN